MRIRVHSRIRIRKDDFGGICYVPHRDDLFAVDQSVYLLLMALRPEWTSVPRALEPAYTKLASFGICDTRPATPELAYSGPSFLGNFEEIPTITDPLVVNCFSTAFCPLRCLYCHADDLMSSAREYESDAGNEIENVIATASMFPAMVAVITGGDPLTRPKRATKLISKLAEQKPVVLDTSGVGPLEELLPVLREHQVHVRVSLDAVGRANDRVRPIDRRIFKGTSPSRYYAQQTIERCLTAGLAVTVQTVVSTHNAHMDELLQLRDLLLSIGVEHWVLHITVEGGSARRIEQQVRRQRSGRGIIPGGQVYSALRAVVSDTVKNGKKIDIRCTDTNTTPNSVVLIDSKGDLYTEGYAHLGKVKLFAANIARPDLVKAKWMHIDRFGHAKRYLNWNKWLFEGKSLEDICQQVPLPDIGSSPQAPSLVETEAKYPVPAPKLAREALKRLGYVVQKDVLQRDEYYDLPDGSVSKLDYVVRVRLENGRVVFAFKGPRFYTATSDYSRLEFQFSVDEKNLRSELARQGLVQTWFFEKRRTDFKRVGAATRVSLDAVPEIGTFAEIEGPLADVRAVAKALEGHLGPQETRNYQVLFLDHKEAQGFARDTVHGAAFCEKS